MALQDYPIPDLDVTMQEAGRVLQLTLNPDLYPQFKNTLGQQRDVLQEVQQRLTVSASGKENWVTEQFKTRLLSCTDPLPTSTALPAVLPPSRARKACTQLERAATLLWAVAKLYSEPSLVEGNVATERTQQSEVFAASRIPGKKHDEIKVCLFFVCLFVWGGLSWLSYSAAAHQSNSIKDSKSKMLNLFVYILRLHSYDANHISCYKTPS